MKKYLQTAYLPLAAAVSGGVAALIRWLLFTFCRDGKGLLISNHPLSWILWILTAVTVAYLVYRTWLLRRGNKYGFNFPASQIGAWGMLAAALGFGITGVTEAFSSPDILSALNALLKIGCVAVFVFLYFCRKAGGRPTSYAYMVICLSLMLDLVCLYRGWSAEPQTQEYCFPLLASVFVMLFGYESAAFCLRMGNRRRYTLFQTAAIFFSIAGLPYGDRPLFYVPLILWLAANPCKQGLVEEEKG